MWPNQQETAETTDLVTFTEETFNEKLHFLCSVKADSLLVFKVSNFLDLPGQYADAYIGSCQTSMMEQK